MRRTGSSSASRGESETVSLVRKSNLCACLGAENSLADLAMSLNDLSLFSRQLARFVENCIGNANFAQIV